MGLVEMEDPCYVSMNTCNLDQYNGAHPYASGQFLLLSVLRYGHYVKLLLEIKKITVQLAVDVLTVVMPTYLGIKGDKHFMSIFYLK